MGFNLREITLISQMLKRFIVVGLNILLATMTFSAQAIAPNANKNINKNSIDKNVGKIASCSKLTSTKYNVQDNQVVVKFSRKVKSGDFLIWSVPTIKASGSCFVSNTNRTLKWSVLKGSQPEDIDTQLLGNNETIFYNLPNYGNVVVNRGQSAQGDRQFFLVRPINTGINLRWYARCSNNSDQVYDANGRYVGSNSDLTIMFSYVCELSLLKPKPIKPAFPSRPQARNIS